MSGTWMESFLVEMYSSLVWLMRAVFTANVAKLMSCVLY